MDADVLTRFREFCVEYGLTQGQAVAFLLDYRPEIEMRPVKEPDD